MRFWLIVAAGLAFFFMHIAGMLPKIPLFEFYLGYYPEAEPTVSFSINGDLTPLEQKLVLESYNSSDPVIKINGETPLPSGILDKRTIIEIDSMTNDKNSIPITTSYDVFRLMFNYTPQGKPLVKHIDITNLKAVDVAVLSIFCEDRNADQLKPRDTGG